MSNPSTLRQAQTDKVIWDSKVIPGLVMTERMLKLLRHRYAHVKSWKQMMLDLEVYLVKNPHKTPKKFKAFVLNCAKRHAEDIRKGLRHPDGKVNLKAFENRGPERPPREKSMTYIQEVQAMERLRKKLGTLQRGTPEYTETLDEFNKIKNGGETLSVGDVFKKIFEVTEVNKQ